MTVFLQRHFALLSITTAILFVVVSAFSLFGNRTLLPASALQVATSTLSTGTLLKWMSMELPALSAAVQTDQPNRNESFLHTLVLAAADVSVNDMSTLLENGLPGLKTPVSPGADETAATPLPSGESSPVTVIPVEDVQKPKDQATGQQPAQAVPTTGDKKVVFIYHSHNRESWLSVTKPVHESVDHPTQNITLVGERLAKELQDLGIGTEINKDDIQQQLIDQGKPYALSYAQSLKAVQAAKREHQEMNYFFDLHRDSSPREKTTVEINGKKYARLLFVVGTRNKNYRKNYAFAQELHRLLEEKYPGLSRGINDKSSEGGNHGEYNQSFSPGSLLIEFGGIHNTPEECYNSAAAFAEIFADYFWQAQRVNAPAPASKADKR